MNAVLYCSVPVQFSRDVDIIHEALDVERQVWGVGTHEFFQLFTLLVEPHQGSGLWLDIKLVLLAKFLTEILHQYLVKVLSSQLWVTSCGKYLRNMKRSQRKSWRNQAKPFVQYVTKEKVQCVHFFSLHTLSLPLLKAHTDVWYPEWPRSTNTTFLAFSSGPGRSCL